MVKRKPTSSPNGENTKKKCKEFDFAAHPKRKIAIQFFYLGWEYDGLVQQANTTNTVEHHIMEALLKTRLIEDWSKCEISRCGRTDKGVSAFRQTIALVVRSNSPQLPGVYWSPDVEESIKTNYKSKDEELSYIKMLNGVLPKTIRVFSWAPVDSNFNARFDCNRRVYKYAFARADLNIDKMKEAARKLIGEHDFSNFCQIDMNEKRLEQSNIRKVYNVSVDEVSSSSSGSEYDLIELTVEGSGFLWHMIRFIVTVLHEVGRGNEEPEVVDDLLNLEKYPSRPQYTTASDTPLCLFDCSYDNSNIAWKTEDSVLSAAIEGLQKTWASYQMRCRMMENMIGELSNASSEGLNTVKGLHEFIQDRPIPAKYTKFNERKLCESVQSKREKLAAQKAAKEL